MKAIAGNFPIHTADGVSAQIMARHAHTVDMAVGDRRILSGESGSLSLDYAEIRIDLDEGRFAVGYTDIEELPECALVALRAVGIDTAEVE